MNLIFLDIDGVLNSSNYMHSLYVAADAYVKRHTLDRNEMYSLDNNKIPLKYKVRDQFGHLFDPACVNYLETLINLTDAKIVISSTWRYSGLLEMKKMWEFRNIEGEVIGITPCYNTQDNQQLETIYQEICKNPSDYKWMDGSFITDNSVGRGHQIEAFLQYANKYIMHVDNYVIFDDDNDMLDIQKDHFVQTDTTYGLTYDNLIKTKEIFQC